MFALLGLAVAVAVEASLPPPQYAFTSFTTSTPSEAAIFCEKYFGATQLTPEQFLTHRQQSPSANVTAVRFPYSVGGARKSHDVYFVHDASKRAGSISPDAYMDRIHKAHHFDVEETWDWWQDWHLCLSAPNVDLVVARLIRDQVPFITRSSYSSYVEVAPGITFQVLGSKMKLAWSEPFNFCRYTSFPPPAMRAQPLPLAPLPSPLPPIPELPPAHHSFFSTVQTAALNFTERHLGASAYDMRGVWSESHRYGDGRCALLAWAQLTHYQLHFVQQYRKTSGDGSLSPPEAERYLTKLHGDMTSSDAFFDNRVGFRVPDLAPFLASLKAAKQPYLLEPKSRSLFMQVPGGIIIELLAACDEAKEGAAAAAAPLVEATERRGGGGDDPCAGHRCDTDPCP